MQPSTVGRIDERVRSRPLVPKSIVTEIQLPLNSSPNDRVIVRTRIKLNRPKLSNKIQYQIRRTPIRLSRRKESLIQSAPLPAVTVRARSVVLVLNFNGLTEISLERTEDIQESQKHVGPLDVETFGLSVCRCVEAHAVAAVALQHFRYLGVKHC